MGVNGIVSAPAAVRRWIGKRVAHVEAMARLAQANCMNKTRFGMT